LKTKQRQTAVNKIRTATRARQLPKSQAFQSCSRAAPRHKVPATSELHGPSQGTQCSSPKGHTTHGWVTGTTAPARGTSTQHQPALFSQSTSTPTLFRWILNAQTSDFKACYGEKERRNGVFKRALEVENEEATEHIGTVSSAGAVAPKSEQRGKNYKQENTNKGTRPVRQSGEKTNSAILKLQNRILYNLKH